MSDLKTYDFADDCGGGMVPHSDGDWVALDDYKRIEAEIERLTADNVRLSASRCDYRATITELESENVRLIAALKNIAEPDMRICDCRCDRCRRQTEDARDALSQKSESTEVENND